MAHSIAFDVSQEMARRISDEARDADKICVVQYWIQRHTDGSCTFVGDIMAWRHSTSPHMYIKHGIGGNWAEQFPIRSKECLVALLQPAGSEDIVTTETAYVILASGVEIPFTFDMEKGGDVTETIDRVFPRHSFYQYIEECEYQTYMVSFGNMLWGLLSQ